MINIRKFTPSDLSRVYDIERQSFKDPYNILFLINLYEMHYETFYVAEENDVVVGYVIGRKVDTSGHILAIAVDPVHRRRGIGRILVGVVIDKFRRLNAREVWLEVRVTNFDAIRFYKKLGFEERGVIPAYYSDGEDAMLLKRYLV